MLQATIVTNAVELFQIHRLNQKNLKQNLPRALQQKEGFVTWLYSIDLLEKMHRLAPSIIVKDEENVAAYALTTLRESREFHPDLETMFRNLEKVRYRNTLLSAYNFYCMGQICVAQEYRGKGLVALLYQTHKKLYSLQYDFILTEISTSNLRSLKAHAKAGFQTIYTYGDQMDEWNVVLWDWT